VLCVGGFSRRRRKNGNVRLTRSVRYSRSLPSLKRVSLNNRKWKEVSFSFLRKSRRECRFPYLLRSYRCSKHCNTTSFSSIDSLSQMHPRFSTTVRNARQATIFSTLWPWEIVVETPRASSPSHPSLSRFPSSLLCKDYYLTVSLSVCSVLLKNILPLIIKSMKES